MKKDLKELYRKYAISYCNYTTKEKYKKATKPYDKLTNIIKKVKSEYNEEQIKVFYNELLKDENIYVKFSAAADCLLSINIFINESIEILQKVSKDSKIHHIIAFDAKMTLKVLKNEL